MSLIFGDIKDEADNIILKFYLMEKGQGESQIYPNRVEVVLGKWQVTVQSLSLYMVEWHIHYEEYN